MDYALTRPNVNRQLADIRARADAVTRDLDAAAFNWQPRDGQAWSIGQCFDHLSRTAAVYAQALDAAIAAAPPRVDGPPATPNVLGRVLIWAIEPPARLRVPARAETAPPSVLDLSHTLEDFAASLDRLSDVAERALRVDAGDARYSNPLAGGSRRFNVVTGVMVMLAHNRRHLVQAEKVRAALGR